MSARPGLGGAVVSDIVEAIVTGSLRPGDRLPPVGELCRRFGVSMTVLRESLNRVEEKGLIDVAQGRGTTITPPSSWNVLDPVVFSAMVDQDDPRGLLDDLSIVRGSLESSLAHAAASRRTAARDRDLRAAFDDSAEIMSASDVDGEGPDDAFHATIREQSGIRLAASIARIVVDRGRAPGRVLANGGREARLTAIEEHRDVLAAILAGDPDVAASAMLAHLANEGARRRPHSRLVSASSPLPVASTMTPAPSR